MVCIVHIQYLPLSHTRGVGVQYKQHAYSTNCSSFDDSDASACPFFDSHSSSFKPLLGSFTISQAPRHCCCQHQPPSVGSLPSRRPADSRRAPPLYWHSTREAGENKCMCPKQAITLHTPHARGPRKWRGSVCWSDGLQQENMRVLIFLLMRNIRP